ncbi:histidine triad nucleotide-binding protein [Actinocorallia lasiicapitis]
MDCLFCKIINGDVPAERVLESEHALAFRDINPAAPVHVLVVPKAHYANLAELGADPVATAAVATLAGEVAQAEGVAETGYRVVFNTGRDASQTVFHVHAHVLGGRGFDWPPG